DDRQRLRGARAGRFGVERCLHRGAHVGWQISGGSDDELENALEEGWQHTGSILSRGWRMGIRNSTVMKFRTERDPLGELKIPAEAYWGVQTARAVENFPISGLRAPAVL